MQREATTAGICRRHKHVLATGAIWVSTSLLGSASAGTLRIPDAGTANLGSSIQGMASIADGRYIAIFGSGSASLYVFDTVSREQRQVNACGSGTISAVTGDGTERVYVGCSGGDLFTWEVDANGLLSVGDGLALRDGKLNALVEHNDLLYVFAQEDAERGSWSTVDISGAPVAQGTGENLVQSTGEVRRVFSGTTGIGITSLLGVERIEPAGTFAIGAAGGFDDIVELTVNFIVTGDGGNVWLYNGNGATALSPASPPGISGNASALGLVDGRLVVGTTDQTLRYYSITGSNVGSVLATLSPPDSGAAGDPVDILEGEGVDVAGTSAGYLWFVTDGPWVTVENPSQAVAGGRGTEFELTFDSDTDGTAQILLNGTTPSNGIEVAGPVNVVADEAVTLSLSMNDDYAEGVNELRVVVTDADGDKGQDLLAVTKDDPPGVVSFVPISQNNPEDARVARGNESLRVNFRTLDEPDITSYVVFFDDEPFRAEDYENCTDREYCGPKFNNSGGPRSPMVITEWSGSTHGVDLQPLENGQQYWIAVRAYDEGGKEGAMSTILTGTPAAGLGPAQLSDETGGVQCGPGVMAGALGVFTGLFAVMGRRRRWTMPLLGLGLVSMAVVGGTAHAKDPDATDNRKGHFQFRYGIFTVEDPSITKVMGENGHDVLWMEFGPYIIPQVEVSAGLGWYQEIGNPILPGGGRSDDNVMLTALPLNVSMNLRADFWKHQVIVPAVGASIEAWPWKQEPYGAQDRLGGMKTGWSWNAGVQILLDRVDKKSASALRVRTGIDDTYLTLTYRDQTIGEADQGLEYSGQIVGIGLKLDY
ncbi:MAG: hypothetical protein CL927_14690 [Deltaproteobacteria bacterium]|nr:hypothetical protein [Deltaproteobacteria bacterium]